MDTVEPVSAPPRRHAWLPFHDPSRPRRLVTVAWWIAGIALSVVVLELVGVDVRGWLSKLWDALREIPAGYLAAGWALQTVQTSLSALGW